MQLPHIPRAVQLAPELVAYHHHRAAQDNVHVEEGLPDVAPAHLLQNMPTDHHGPIIFIPTGQPMHLDGRRDAYFTMDNNDFLHMAAVGQAPQYAQFVTHMDPSVFPHLMPVPILHTDDPAQLQQVLAASGHHVVQHVDHLPEIDPHSVHLITIDEHAQQQHQEDLLDHHQHLAMIQSGMPLL